jgi:hypothetical protein
MKNITAVTAKIALLSLIVTMELSQPVSAKQTAITCPESHNGREVFYLIASTKNYQIKICGETKGSFFMFITRDKKTTIAKIHKDGSFIASRNGYVYEVVAESRWNDGLGQSESYPVSFTIHKGQKQIVEEKIMQKSVGGYFMLP